MTNPDIISQKIDHLAETLRSQSKDISTIKEAIVEIAVQSTEIKNLTKDIDGLKKNKDHGCKRISEIEKFQAGCPRDEINRTFKWMWGAIAAQSTVILFIVGMLIRGAKI
jgi:hypothetical protein